jgi:acyl dehydratase
VTSATIDELAAKVGSELGVSGWQTIDQETIDTFAKITRDEQWIHVDTSRAEAGPFGTTIAHGFLTLSLCTSILEECLVVSDARMTINYGLDRVRFPAPVPAGSRVRGHTTLVSHTPSDDGAQLVLRIEVETDAGPKPACVADLVVRYQR